jgi:hypothetical protein
LGLHSGVRHIHVVSDEAALTVNSLFLYTFRDLFLNEFVLVILSLAAYVFVHRQAPFIPKSSHCFHYFLLTRKTPFAS